MLNEPRSISIPRHQLYEQVWSQPMTLLACPGRSILTGREFLYHLYCEPSARKLEDFGSGWQAPETAMWTDRISGSASVL